MMSWDDTRLVTHKCQNTQSTISLYWQETVRSVCVVPVKVYGNDPMSHIHAMFSNIA